MFDTPRASQQKVDAGTRSASVMSFAGVQMHAQSRFNDLQFNVATSRQIDLGDSQLRVLVVDDNVNAAQALAAYFSFENMACRMAFGGVEAIAASIIWAPHVVVMDISMPECNGFQAALALRRDERTNGIVIIAFTALDEREIRRDPTGLEFDAYYQKGQSPSRLVTLIATFAK
jgi:two-component system OmpR family response regulator